MRVTRDYGLINAIRTRNKDDAEDMEKAIKDIEEGAINKK